jgi:hypothetical protein
MSRIDEGKLVDGLTRIAEYFRAVSDLSLKCSLELADLLKVTPPELKKETAEPSETAIWIRKEGSGKPFELLNDYDTAQYRELKAELDRGGHPLQKQIHGVAYTVWLMRDGQAIGRRRKSP